METFAAALADRLKGNGRSATSTLFSKTFVSAGAFDAFFGGQGGPDLEQMSVAKFADKVLFARIDNLSVRPGSSVSGLFTASATVTFRVLSASNGRILDSFEVKATGPGTSEPDAKAAALDRALDQASRRGF
jgi:hypothetical protein